MAGVDEPLVGGRPAVAVVDGEPQHTVVAPVVVAVEGVDGQQLDEVDAEFDEVIEPFDRRVERAVRGERAEVQLVDHAFRAAAVPSSRRPPTGERAGSKVRDSPWTPSGCQRERGSGSGSGSSSSRKP